jgi:predicted CopG family antitoxin
MCGQMPSKTVSLETSAFKRLKAAKRPDESFSDTINRLLKETRPSFRVLAGTLTVDDARKVRRALAAMRQREAPAERAWLEKLGRSSGGNNA